ncbi:RICIN domain-containing protein [Streptomyces sp. NPDC006872]|uniref:RICIN domain-containing protein n=1 Tax=Streptomyces sp. NPDC006872 TaxID=3155720 RepID=UPI0033C8921E
MTYTEKLDAGQTEGTQTPTQSRTAGRIAHRVWTMVLALAASMGFVFLNAGSASALNAGDVIRVDLLRNWETGRCLMANRVTASVTTEPCQSGNVLQTWAIVYATHISYDIVQIRLNGTGLCLDQRNDVSIAPCMGINDGYGDNQYWYGQGSSWDQVMLDNLAWGVGVLDSNYNGDVYIHEANWGGYQKWKSGY